MIRIPTTAAGSFARRTIQATKRRSAKNPARMRAREAQGSARTGLRIFIVGPSRRHYRLRHLRLWQAIGKSATSGLPRGSVRVREFSGPVVIPSLLALRHEGERE